LPGITAFFEKKEDQNLLPIKRINVQLDLPTLNFPKERPSFSPMFSPYGSMNFFVPSPSPYTQAQVIPRLIECSPACFTPVAAGFGAYYAGLYETQHVQPCLQHEKVQTAELKTNL
jgi:hypothetical protein